MDTETIISGIIVTVVGGMILNKIIKNTTQNKPVIEIHTMTWSSKSGHFC